MQKCMESKKRAKPQKARKSGSAFFVCLYLIFCLCGVFLDFVLFCFLRVGFFCVWFRFFFFTCGMTMEQSELLHLELEITLITKIGRTSLALFIFCIWKQTDMLTNPSMLCTWCICNVVLHMQKCYIVIFMYFNGIVIFIQLEF